ncbi:MAG: YceI family protein [Candidatus Moranbacteria bacterium]|nr:YceI family protein [Candidatus Moranbacteria bacterium]
MKSSMIVFLVLLMSVSTVYPQKYMSRNGHIRFFSSAPLEDIEAHNRQVNVALDIETGDFVFRVLIRSFEFEKALMQEHFNENYMESHKFPNASFQGKVTNLSDVDFTKNGTYEATVEGKLTIHGVTKDIVEKGTFTVENGLIVAYSQFNVKVADFDIKIPKTVVNNIAENIQVTVDVKLEKL